MPIPNIDVDLETDTANEDMEILKKAIGHLNVDGQAHSIRAQPKYCCMVTLEDADESGKEDADQDPEDDANDDGWTLAEDSDSKIPIWEMLNESFEQELVELDMEVEQYIDILSCLSPCRQ